MGQLFLHPRKTCRGNLTSQKNPCVFPVQPPSDLLDANHYAKSLAPIPMSFCFQCFLSGFFSIDLTSSLLVLIKFCHLMPF